MNEKVTLADRIQGLMGFLLEKSKPRPRKREKRHFATIQDRLLAGVLDMSLLFLLFYDILNAIWHYMAGFIRPGEQVTGEAGAWYGEAPATEGSRAVQLLLNSNYPEIWILYNVIMTVLFGVVVVLVWRRFNTSPGKWLMGLRLADAEGEGAPEKSQYLKRYLGYYLSMPVLMAGFLMGAFHPKKQAWHDRLSGTTVVYTEEGHILKRAWNYLLRRIRGKKPDEEKSDGA
jgi:uncharacterized RDD family membrane protein YckC